MDPLQDVHTALSVAFLVTLDQHDLGAFSGCDGLGCEVVLETREEGGNNTHVWQLPTRLKYSNIKLSRPLGPDTQKVALWFSSIAAGYDLKTTGTIEAMRADGKAVASWSLRGVVPVRWSGPSFSADSPKVLVETIEIAHHGFTATPAPPKT